MAGNITIPYMIEYLGYAIQFEKYVYIWSNAMEEANDQMRVINNRQRDLQQQKQSLSGRQGDFSFEVTQKKNEILKRKKNRRTYRIVALLAAVLSLGAGIIMCFVNGRDISLSGVFAGFVLWPFVYISTLVGPCCIVFTRSEKKKIRKLENEISQLSDYSFVNSYNAGVQQQQESVENYIQETNKAYMVISYRQDEIFKELQNARETLQQIYSMNLIPMKYRNIEAVATFYEYLTTRRCDKINGHGGIYDTYEVERLKIEELKRLAMIEQRLSNIEDINRCIYSEMQQANRTLSGIKNSLTNIESQMEDINKNTAMIAVSQQQSAASLKWIEWNSYK